VSFVVVFTNKEISTKDAAYCGIRSGVVCQLVTTAPPLHHAKTDGPQVSRYWAQARVYKMGCALAPPGEYDEPIDAAAAMWTVATVMSTYAQSRTETVSLLAPPG